MADHEILTARSRRLAFSTWTIVLLVGLMTWGYARSGSSPTMTRAAVAPLVSKTAANVPSPPADADVRRIPSSVEPSPTGGLIGTLRQQIAQSPLLGDAAAQTPLLESLDRAGTIWTRTQRQNREALRQLNRQVRIGESRLTPHLVLVTFDRAGDFNDGRSARGKFFADLSTRGVTFRQHYAGGESPASGWWTLMTGRNSGRARQGEERFQLRETEPNLSSALWQAGYATGFIGVWHEQTSPVDMGFDDWTGWRGQTTEVPLFPTVLHTARTKMAIRANEGEKPTASLGKLLSVEMESFLSNHAVDSRPFFLQVRLTEYTAGSSTEAMESPENIVRHLFDCLHKLGIEQRTCVFITTLSGKETGTTSPLSEAALRAPLVMVGGRQIVPGTEVVAPTAAWDIFPTMQDIAQSTRRATATDGISLLTFTGSDAVSSPRLLYWETDRAGRAQAVRKGEWKGTAMAGDREMSLFHLPTDPKAEKNVAADHLGVVQELRAPTPSTDASTARLPKADST